MSKFYQIKAFSQLTSVTVRTLHYYDEIGLLKPSAKTQAGHRLYTQTDLLRLQQIITFKFMGFALSTIQKLLRKQDFDIQRSLQMQADSLLERASQMTKAAKLIQLVVDGFQGVEKMDWQAMTHIIEVIQNSDHQNWFYKYFNKQEQKQIEDLNKRFSEKEFEQYTKRWRDLIVETKQKLTEDPTSEVGKQIAERWKALADEALSDDQFKLKIWIGMKTEIIPKTFFPYDEEMIQWLSKAVKLLDP